MTRAIPRPELYTALGCNGGVRLSTGGFVWPWHTAESTEAEDAEQSLVYTMPPSADAAQVVKEGHVTRLWRSDTDYEEWIVRKVTKRRARGGLVTVTCGPVSYLLAEHGFVPEWQTTDPAGDPLLEVSATGTLTDLWQTYVLDNPKVNARLPFLGLGTIVPTVEVAVSWSFATAKQFIDLTIAAAEAKAGVPYRFSLERNGSTSYDLTVKTA